MNEPVKVGDVLAAVEEAMPAQWAEPWDNCGLVCGDADAAVTGVLLTLDATESAVRRATDAGANLLVTHHPPHLEGARRLVSGHGLDAALAATAAGVSIISAHTNLDRSPAGARVLADALGLVDTQPLERSSQSMSLVTVYVPAESAAAVLGAMREAGAGRIGLYDGCAFSNAGTGTFIPRQGSEPTVGTSGEQVESAEDRLEMVVAPANEAAVMAAAVAAHPYEEPLVVASQVRIARGAARMGRVGELPAPAALRVFAEQVATVFDCSPRVWGDPDAPVVRVATATGSGGSLIGDAIYAGANVLLAGEVRYHDALNAVASGLAVVEAGHDVTEWPLIPVLAQAVRATPGLAASLVHEEDARRGWWVP